MGELGFFRKLTAGHLRKHRLEALLCLIGVALGVAVVIAIDAAVLACVSSFQGAVTTLAERSTHSIFAEQGTLPDQAFIDLSKKRTGSAMAPMIDRGVLASSAAKPDGAVVARLLGVDVFSERALRSFTNMKSTLDENAFRDFLTQSGQVVLMEPLAERLVVKAGDEMQMTIGNRRVAVRVAGIAKPEGFARSQLSELIIADLATAQELTQSPGRLDRIDLNIASPADEQIVRASLPAGAVLRSTQQQSTSLADLIASYKLNLNSLSLMASFVAIFIVYNSMLISVRQRATSLGILRCLGGSRGQLARLYLTEAMMVAIIGGILGVLAGWWLSRSLVGYVGTTINDLYANVRPATVNLDGMMFAKGLVVSVMSCLIGSAVPLVQAARTPPVNMMRATARSNAAHRGSTMLLITGIILLVVAMGVYQLPGDSPVAGFVMALLIALGFALVCPFITRCVCGLLAWVARRRQWLPMRMAADGVTRSLGITGIAVAAMMLAMGMSIAVRTMVSSFRGALGDWLDRRFSADVFIAPELLVNHKIDATIDPRIEQWVLNQPETKHLIHYRVTTIDLAGKPTMLVGTDVQKLTQDNPFPIKSQMTSGAFDARKHVFVSEPLAGRMKLKLGDSIMLDSPTGRQTFGVYGIHYDFGSERGQVLLDRAVYAAAWNDTALTSLHVRIREGLHPPDVAARWSAVLRRDYPVISNSFAGVRREVLEIFDRTFKVTDVLSWLSGGVAFCGLAGSLLALALARQRDYNLLTAIGMSTRQTATWVLAQGLLIAWISAIIAAFAGTILAWVLSHVIQYRSFGWSIPTSAQPRYWIESFVLATVAAVVAAVYPIRRLRSSPPADGLRQE